MCLTKPRSMYINHHFAVIRDCLDSRRTYSVKFTITTRLKLYAQLQLFSFGNNQPLYHLQRERFVQPLLQSGTLLVSTPAQLIRF